jgi:TrmH family RNA methyltransferase
VDAGGARPSAIPEGQPLVLALDRLQDPGNLGTIIRTADWFGVRHIVCSLDSVSCFNPKVVQSTMGSLFRTSVSYTDLHDYLNSCGKPVFGALLDGQSIWSPHTPLQLPAEGAVLVVGNESRGISPEVQECITHRVSIPNVGGTAESLNASVACAILMAQLIHG